MEHLDGFGIELDLTGILLGQEEQIAEAPLFVLDPQQRLGLHMTDQRRLAHHPEQLLQGQILAQIGLELRLRPP